MGELTDYEIDVIRHALGLGSPRRWAYRNYFAAGSRDALIWDALVSHGLAKAHGNRPSETMPYPCYSVTEAGAKAAGVWRNVPNIIRRRMAAGKVH